MSGRAGNSSQASAITSYSWSEDFSTELGDAVEVANKFELQAEASSIRAWQCDL